MRYIKISLHEGDDLQTAVPVGCVWAGIDPTASAERIAEQTCTVLVEQLLRMAAEKSAEPAR